MRARILVGMHLCMQERIDESIRHFDESIRQYHLSSNTSEFGSSAPTDSKRMHRQDRADWQLDGHQYVFLFPFLVAYLCVHT